MMLALFIFLRISSPISTNVGQASEIKVSDIPNDKGEAISVEWKLPSTDSSVVYYNILRADNRDGKYDSVGTVLKGSNKFEDKSVKDGKPYWYKICAVSLDSAFSGFIGIEPSDSVTSSAQWFNHKRWNVLILGLIICGLALLYIWLAKKGVPLFIRNIPGLEAVDEAVGRATEMGRPILYITGLGDMSDISTIASLSILERVAKRAAMHGTALIVPTYDPVVMSAAQEVVKQAHEEVGRPDTYDESKIFYLTADQFGYAAGVDGIMLRDRPGAVFMQGYFFAEALIMAETGNSIGAIQIAGTPATSQLPFFVAACDYTLIGEEMFAASAYLSREPLMLGSIKGEDYAKIIVIIIIVTGVLFATIAGLFNAQNNTFLNNFINWFTPI
ncbi:MAG: DUF6754 domain-containing protein [bacterium]